MFFFADGLEMYRISTDPNEMLRLLFEAHGKLNIIDILRKEVSKYLQNNNLTYDVNSLVHDIIINPTPAICNSNPNNISNVNNNNIVIVPIISSGTFEQALEKNIISKEVYSEVKYYIETNSILSQNQFTTGIYAMEYAFFNNELMFMPFFAELWVYVPDENK